MQFALLESPGLHLNLVEAILEPRLVAGAVAPHGLLHGAALAGEVLVLVLVARAEVPDLRLRPDEVDAADPMAQTHPLR